MSQLLTLAQLAVAVAALAMFGVGLSDALQGCSARHWINCDWDHVRALSVWLVPVAIIAVIGIGRAVARRGKK